MTMTMWAVCLHCRHRAGSLGLCCPVSLLPRRAVTAASPCRNACVMMTTWAVCLRCCCRTGVLCPGLHRCQGLSHFCAHVVIAGVLWQSVPWLSPCKGSWRVRIISQKEEKKGDVHELICPCQGQTSQCQW